MTKKKKIKHNYTSELELKSLLIRIKNTKEEKGTKRLNSRINKYIKLHTSVCNIPSPNPKKTRLKRKLKEAIIRDSVKTCVDKQSFERFGVIILLMIKNILTLPKWSNYTYEDDFYSDACGKILKYLHNFDHTLISERTGQPGNAFAYISQYINNSIKYILNTKKKEREDIAKHIRFENLGHGLQLQTMEIMKESTGELPPEEKVKDIHLEDVTSLTQVLENLQSEIDNNDRLNIYYPKSYTIEYEELTKLSELMKSKVSLIRDDVENEDKE